MKKVKPFMRYCLSRLRKAAKDKQYRIYVTEALKHMAHLNASYIDLIEPKKPIDVKEQRSRILQKLRE